MPAATTPPTTPLRGIALIGAAAVLWGTYGLPDAVGRDLGNRLGVQRLTVASFAGAALLLLPVTAVLAGLHLGDQVVVLGGMMYLGVVPTALAYALFFRGLQRVPASTAAVLVLLEPLTATALAMLLVGERLSAAGWLGAVLLLLAVVVVSGPRPLQTGEATPARRCGSEQ